jgi:hypothetical protein
MGHDHHHEHDHHHGSTYFIDQLCTIGACAALGAVAILMYRASGPTGQRKLSYILAEQFFVPVLIGGIALLVLVAIRAVTLWREAGEARAHVHEHHHHHHEHDHHHHDHDHAHNHAHDHSHDHAHAHSHSHEHSHDHGHEHGWTPARYAVLMLPIVLYFLNLPNSSFSAERFGRDLAANSLEGPTHLITDQGQAYGLGFKELTAAAFFAEQRAAHEGKTGKLRGKFSPLASDKEFTLFRVKMNCCAADAIPVGVRIISAENITRFTPGQWVEAEGQIQFHKVVGQEKYMPVLLLKSADQVKPIPPQPDYGLD